MMSEKGNFLFATHNRIAIKWDISAVSHFSPRQRRFLINVKNIFWHFLAAYRPSWFLTLFRFSPARSLSSLWIDMIGSSPWLRHWRCKAGCLAHNTRCNWLRNVAKSRRLFNFLCNLQRCIANWTERYYTCNFVSNVTNWWKTLLCVKGP